MCGRVSPKLGGLRSLTFEREEASGGGKISCRALLREPLASRLLCVERDSPRLRCVVCGDFREGQLSLSLDVGGGGDVSGESLRWRGVDCDDHTGTARDTNFSDHLTEMEEDGGGAKKRKRARGQKRKSENDARQKKIEEAKIRKLQQKGKRDGDPHT